MKFKTYLIPLLISLIATSAYAGAEGGNGGDPLVYRMESARGAATIRLEWLTQVTFTDSVKPEFKDYLLANKAKLIDDIRRSKHDWIKEAQPTCAITTAGQGSSPISFSLKTCSGISLTEAIALIVHESIHHIDGNKSEQFAYDASQALLSARLITMPSFANEVSKESSVPVLTNDFEKEVIKTLSDRATAVMNFGGVFSYSTQGRIVLDNFVAKDVPLQIRGNALSSQIAKEFGVKKDGCVNNAIWNLATSYGQVNHFNALAVTLTLPGVDEGLTFTVGTADAEGDFSDDFKKRIHALRSEIIRLAIQFDSDEYCRESL